MHVVHTSQSGRGLFNLMMFAWLGSEWWIRASRRPHNARTQDRGTGAILRWAFLVGIGGGILATSIGLGPSLPGRSWATFITGLVLAAMGMALRLWSVVTLGEWFQLNLVIQEGHGVTRRGPYRVLRHPSYAGGWLTCIGMGIALGTWIGLAMLVVLPGLAYWRRIVVEEGVLLDGLGRDYADYRTRTWRVVPGIW